MRSIAAVCALVCFAASPASADEGKARHERLAALGRLWGAVRIYHPWLAYRDIDWDGALVAAVPKVASATGDEETVAALRSLTAALGDAATTIASTRSANALAGTDASRNVLDWPEPGILAIRLGGFENYRSMFEFTARARPMLADAKAVVVDLRGGGNEDADVASGYVAGEICKHLVTRALQAPAQRALLHSGFMSQARDMPSSGGYYSAFVMPFASTFLPETGAVERRIVVLANQDSALADVILALLDGRYAQLVLQGGLTDTAIITLKSVDIGLGLRARVRASELTSAFDPKRLAAVTFPANGPPRADDAAFGAALDLARGGAPAAPPARLASAPLPEGRFRWDDRYEKMTAPALPYRMLALFRYWNAIHDFYPYLSLLDEDWNATLPGLVGLFEKAEGEPAYAKAVAEMVARVSDGHSSVQGNPALLEQIFGTAPPPFRARRIDGAPVVAEVTNPDAAAGIAVGDVLVSVDGEAIEKRIARVAPYVAAATASAKAYHLLNSALRGADGSTCEVLVRSAHGKEKTVAVKRSRSFALVAPRTPHFRVLGGNVGYADLTRLTGDEVEPMFEELAHTRALVLDMRGYPNGTAWQIAPRLNVRGSRFGAAFQRRMPSGLDPDDTQEARFGFLQELPKDPAAHAKYDKPTVMLIDERTISQAEHSGLFFEAAAGTRFVGSQTAGADGDVVAVALPGGLLATFTGHDVRHADGRRLQRVGLVPDVEVHPTVAGLRAGRDEVLERALRLLQRTAANATHASPR